ncbi:MAG: terminase [Aestuariibacter sp.]|nr:terminase [Aestuariibacter sp.]
MKPEGFEVQQRTSSKILQAVKDGAGSLQPPPPRTPDQWANQCRVLPAGSAEPGPWRSERTPFMIPIQRACAEPRYRRIVVACGSQMGKTEGLLNVLGWRLDDDPCPMLYIGPTQKNVESVSTDRVMKMFRSVSSLWDKLSKGKANKITEKHVAGIRLGFGWAGSATELSSHPAGLVLVDERDRMDNDVEGEGDPVELAEARTSTYPDGRVIIVSTPTTEGASPIWDLYEEGTNLKWAWPCPECGEYFIARLELLQWPENCTPQRALTEAKLACPKCGSLIGDEQKPGMNDKGVFVGTGQTVTPEGEVIGESIESDTASFWISGLCSPWRTFGQRAKAFIAATKSGVPGRIQAVINTGFGELYRIAGDAPDWGRVASLRQPYEFDTLPEGVQIITCGVDVQKNRLVYAVRGWGYNSESWLIRHGELWGETEHDAVWLELAKLLDVEYEGLKIRRMLIDSGYKPGKGRGSDNQIYKFCRQFRSLAFPGKGHDRQDKPLKASKIDVSVRGKIIKNGLQLWHLDSDYFKSWVYSRIEWPQDEPGGWHIPQDADDDYCQQVVAEQRLVKASGHVTWISVRKDNHYLDCEALNAAAAHMLQVHALKKSTPPINENKPISRPTQKRHQARIMR